MRSTLKLFVWILIAGIFITSCKKEDITPSNENNPPNTPAGTSGPIGSGTFITTTIGGTILDQNDQPVVDALITIGTKTATTNDLGNFIISDVSVDSDRAYVKVEKAGYFPGSRAFNPEAGATHHVKVKLLSKTLAGSFSNDTGATITSSGASLLFEAGDVSLENGNPYNGVVNVYASYLNPMASDLSEIMPGNLSAKDANNNVVFLETYGMVVVELEGSNGEALNVAPGETVDLSMTVQSPQAANAPATIPLWYFDETYGNWVEEGSASLMGSTYVGEVAHFTYWNCDDPYDPVTWSITLECEGTPLSNTTVELVNTNTGLPYGASLTNSLGQITDPIPMGLPLTMHIYDNCGGLVYTQDLGVVTSHLDLGTIEICSSLPNSQLIATVVDCNGNPVPNAIVAIATNGMASSLYTDANGNISGNFIHCNQATLDIMAYDPVTNMHSVAQTVSNAPVINADTIQICTQSTEFFEYTVDGTHYFFNDSINLSASVSATLPTYVTMTASNGGSGPYFNLMFYGSGVGTFENHHIFPGVGTHWLDNGVTYYAATGSFDVNVTEFASVQGAYFEGTFGGTFNDTEGNPHTLSGSFVIQRD